MISKSQPLSDLSWCSIKLRALCLRIQKLYDVERREEGRGDETREESSSPRWLSQLCGGLVAASTIFTTTSFLSNCLCNEMRKVMVFLTLAESY